ncbi:hypothetical protein F2Q68_00027668 [Brassica cretica]|uniref:Uncharacterized protein n=1 Tax=Brassica cretica TaxID=69181 RepID=A0A8S9IIJ5_BRACR|nr:hypothetical protein F2Q68_00027668 [Brassica cretica]
MDDRWSLESVTALVTGGSLRVWYHKAYFRKKNIGDSNAVGDMAGTVETQTSQVDFIC